MLEGKRVLVLEDEPIIGFALEDMLYELGCRSVVITTHLDDAGRLVDEGAVDLAVLDVNIHGKRSYPVADRLAGRGRPFIFATGYGDTEHPERYRSFPTVTKPYRLADLKSALEVIL